MQIVLRSAAEVIEAESEMTLPFLHVMLKFLTIIRSLKPEMRDIFAITMSGFSYYPSSCIISLLFPGANKNAVEVAGSRISAKTNDEHPSS
jgi:hypothetical protein